MLKMRTQKKVRNMVKKAYSFLKKCLNHYKQNFGGNTNFDGAKGKEHVIGNWSKGALCQLVTES